MHWRAASAPLDAGAELQPANPDDGYSTCGISILAKISKSSMAHTTLSDNSMGMLGWLQHAAEVLPAAGVGQKEAQGSHCSGSTRLLQPAAALPARQPALPTGGSHRLRLAASPCPHPCLPPTRLVAQIPGTAFRPVCKCPWCLCRCMLGYNMSAVTCLNTVLYLCFTDCTTGILRTLHQGQLWPCWNS